MVPDDCWGTRNHLSYSGRRGEERRNHRRYKISLLVTTPTFLRGYLKRAEPEQFASIKLLVTGAEKLPRELAIAFEQKFGKHVLEGYGLTETAPVVSTNLPDPAPSRPNDTVQPSSRDGSVGKMLPGEAAQIRDPETNALLSPHELGMLWLKGPNIFEGYLNEPERTAEVLQDGGLRPGTSAGSTKTDSSTSRGDYRVSRRLPAKWFRTKRSNRKSSKGSA